MLHHYYNKVINSCALILAKSNFKTITNYSLNFLSRNNKSNENVSVILSSVTNPKYYE